MRRFLSKGWRRELIGVLSLLLATIAILQSAGPVPARTATTPTATGTSTTPTRTGASTTSASTGAPYGALTALSGPGACFGDGCPPLRGIPGGPGSSGGLTLHTLELTSNRSSWAHTSGRTLYVTSVPDSSSADSTSAESTGGAPWSIAVLDRDPQTGLLSQPAGQRGCITTAHRLQGCAFVAAGGQVVDLVISPDGTKVAVESISHGASTESCVAAGAAFICGGARYRLLARDPQTGELRPIGGVRRCLLIIDYACGAVHGLRVDHSLTSVPLTPNTRILAGPAAGGQANAAGIAFQHRAKSGAWHEPSGADGCTNEGGSDGCHALDCLTGTVTAAAVGDGNRVFAVGAGEHGIDYVATLQHTTSGLKPIGCSTFATSPAGGTAGTPVWVHELVGSSTVLIAARSHDDTGGADRERIYAATPKTLTGVPTQPRPISEALGFADGIPVLGCNCARVRPRRDSQTLYGADASGLYVYQAIPTAVTPLPAPWFNPYSTPVAANGRHDYGVDDTPLIAPNGRDLYVVTGPFQHPQTSGSPGIRVYRVQT